MSAAGRLYRSLTICLGCLFAAVAASAATFPDKPVQLVVGFAAGGGADRVARLLAPVMTQKWGQQVIVVNKPAAGGVVATEYVANATPNGHTILLTGNAHTVTPHEIKVPYDPIRDFAPVTRLGEQPSILLTNLTLPAKTLKEFVALAKSKPGQLNYSSTGGGSPTNLQMLLLMKNLELNLTNVTYRGGGDAILALIRGEVQATFFATTGSRGPLQAGSVRPLAITSDQRLPLFPDIPTIPEALGVSRYDGTNVWHGVVAPRGTPAAIVSVIREAVVEAAKSQDFQKVMAQDGYVIIASTPKEFGDFLRADFAKWGTVLKRTDTK